MTVGKLLEEISQFLGFSIPEAPVVFTSDNTGAEEGYLRSRWLNRSPLGVGLQPRRPIGPPQLPRPQLTSRTLSTQTRDTVELTAKFVIQAMRDALKGEGLML